MADQTGSRKSRDLSRRPISFWIGWGLPIVILLSMNFARGVIPFEGILYILSGSLAWMGIGFLINARRCKRRHCYLAGPVLLLGAAGVLLVGFEHVDLEADGLIYMVWGTGILVGLTFMPEWILGPASGIIK